MGQGDANRARGGAPDRCESREGRWEDKREETKTGNKADNGLSLEDSTLRMFYQAVDFTDLTLALK